MSEFVPYPFCSASVQLQSNAEVKVGDRSTAIPLLSKRANLFRGPGNVQYFFAGNGYSPMFIQAAVPECDVATMNPRVELVSVSRQNLEPVVCGSNMFELLATRTQGMDVIVFKVIFASRGPFSRNFFFFDVCFDLPNGCVLRVRSDFFRVATKPSRLVLTGFDSTWTVEQLRGLWPELRVAGAHAPEIVQCSELEARVELVDPHNRDDIKLMLECTKAACSGSVVGCFFINFANSTRCVDFYIKSRDACATYCAEMTQAPKRVWRDVKVTLPTPAVRIEDPRFLPTALRVAVAAPPASPTNSDASGSLAEGTVVDASGSPVESPMAAAVSDYTVPVPVAIPVAGPSYMPSYFQSMLTQGLALPPQAGQYQVPMALPFMSSYYDPSVMGVGPASWANFVPRQAFPVFSPKRSYESDDYDYDASTGKYYRRRYM